MNLTEYLSAEWRPALGCTEPAAVAYAACLAAGQAGGSPRSVQLVLDARTYKNCHAVGIPNSGHQSGVLWALALGAAKLGAKLDGDVPKVGVDVPSVSGKGEARTV